jgi:hypothetical protein
MTSLYCDLNVSLAIIIHIYCIKDTMARQEIKYKILQTSRIYSNRIKLIMVTGGVGNNLICNYCIFFSSHIE